VDSQQISFEAKSVEIKKKLEDLNEEINTIFGGNTIDTIKTEEIKRKFKHYAETEIVKINTEIKQAVAVLDSPIFVGLIGRYSHGKTALVNALFELDDEFKLPEGESIVTSKVTRVEFNHDIATPRCFKCLIDDTKKQVEIEELKLSVSGKVMTDDSSINFYEMKLPAKKQFAKIFADKKINLIDMPGLGGVYTRDTAKTRKYIENCDLLLVTIKLLDIDNAASTLEPYINSLSIPIIPVLTFLDEWKSEKDNQFKVCKEYVNLINKARELLRLSNSSLANCLDLIAVSAPRNEGIVALRENLLNFITKQNLAIKKIENEEPIVFKRKINELIVYLQRVIVQTDTSLDRLEKDIVSMLPEKGDFVSFQKHFAKKRDKIIKDVKKNIRSSAKEIFSNFASRMDSFRYLTSYKEIGDFISNLQDDVNNKAVKDFKKQLEQEFADIKSGIETEVEKYINKMELNSAEKDVRKETIRDKIEEYEIDLDIADYKAPQFATDQFAGVAKGIGETLINAMRNRNMSMKMRHFFQTFSVAPPDFLLLAY